MTNQPHAIIVGVGIDALASGIALGRIGWTVNIYEQAPELHKGLRWPLTVSQRDPRLGEVRVTAGVCALQLPIPSGGIYT